MRKPDEKASTRGWWLWILLGMLPSNHRLEYSFLANLWGLLLYPLLILGLVDTRNLTLSETVFKNVYMLGVSCVASIVHTATSREWLRGLVALKPSPPSISQPLALLLVHYLLALLPVMTIKAPVEKLLKYGWLGAAVALVNAQLHLEALLYWQSARSGGRVLLAAAQGPRFLVSTLSVCGEFLFKAFVFLYFRPKLDLTTPFYAFLDLASIYLVLQRTEAITFQAGEDEILNLRTTSLNDLQFDQLLTRLYQLEQNRNNVIHAWGIFPMRKSFFGAFLKTTLTLMIVMGQLSTEIKHVIDFYDAKYFSKSPT